MQKMILTNLHKKKKTSPTIFMGRRIHYIFNQCDKLTNLQTAYSLDFNGSQFHLHIINYYQSDFFMSYHLVSIDTFLIPLTTKILNRFLIICHL